MGRQRGFLPPNCCEDCRNAPELGTTLWPGEKWRCLPCLEKVLPGKDVISKSMHQNLEHAQAMQEAFALEAKGEKAADLRNQAEWARLMAGEITRQAQRRVRTVPTSTGEVVRPGSGLPETADLAAVEASLERSRLLLQSGTDIAALALDTASSIEAQNSLEKMLAHQLAAAHKVVMRQVERAYHAYETGAETKRLSVALRSMAVFQQGLLALRKIRQGGQQQITVQYVNVSDGSRAVIGEITNSRT